MVQYISYILYLCKIGWLQGQYHCLKMRTFLKEILYRIVPEKGFQQFITSLFSPIKYIQVWPKLFISRYLKTVKKLLTNVEKYLYIQNKNGLSLSSENYSGLVVRKQITLGPLIHNILFVNDKCFATASNEILFNLIYI